MTTINNPVQGIFLLDKPAGISSSWALRRVKGFLKADKAGHTGTLDPLARGMLPICLGEAAKFSQFLLDADKTYQAVLQLGQTSSTGDAAGELSDKNAVPALNTALIEAALAAFRGPIQQIPPMYAAIKHQGRPLYKWARKGIDIERPARNISIHRLTLISFTETTITIEATCSKGTYIRVLAEDIGNALGCGAYLADLYRTEVAPFKAAQMLTFEALELLSPEDIVKNILPIPVTLQHLPVYAMSVSEAERVILGQKLAPRLEVFSPGIYQLICTDGRFIGIGEVMENGVLRAKRMLSPIKAKEYSHENYSRTA